MYKTSIYKTIAAITVALSIFSTTGCFLKPYRADVQQGNVLDIATVQKLNLGMNKHNVEELLGTPILGNVFGGSSWSYVYTYQANGGKIEKKQLILHFAKDKLTRIEKNNLNEQN